MSKFILVSGKKGAGKDYLASHIAYRLQIKHLAFATAIKDIICVTLGLTRGQLDDLKNSDEACEFILTGGLVKRVGFRGILQRFGTQAMKPIFGEGVWVDALCNQVADETVVVSDFRFKEEYNLLKSKGHEVITIRVLGGKTGDTHISEIDLDDFPFDLYIDNEDKSLSAQTLYYEYGLGDILND